MPKQGNTNYNICLSVDKTSRTPIHQQIYFQLASLINNNVIPPGSKIPSIRALAKDLGISDKPVRTAYSELISDLLLESLPGVGMFTSSARFTGGKRSLTSIKAIVRQVPGPIREFVEPRLSYEQTTSPPVSDIEGDLIQFAKSIPDPSLFPFENIKQSVTNVVWNPDFNLFDRGHAQGYNPLIEYIETLMDATGIPMSADANDIIITDGFHQSLRMVLSCCDLGEKLVLIESPAYPPLIRFLIVQNIPFTDFPVGLSGIDFEVLSKKLECSKIAAMIVTPTYHNPTGLCYSSEDRNRLMELALKHKVVIIEDDWGRNLRLDGDLPQPIKALDCGGYVYHLGSFSKCFLPGLKLGWVTCPAQSAKAALRFKAATEGSANHFIQALLFDFIAKGSLDRYIRKSAKIYKSRRDALIETLEKELPEECKFLKPSGGYSVWVNLPDRVDVGALYKEARKQGVLLTPGHFCFAPDKGTNGIRLSFSRANEKDLRIGAKIICDLLHKQING